MLTIRHPKDDGPWYVGYLELETSTSEELWTEIAAFTDRTSALRLVHFLNGGTINSLDGILVSEIKEKQ